MGVVLLFVIGLIAAIFLWQLAVETGLEWLLEGALVLFFAAIVYVGHLSTTSIKYRQHQDQSPNQAPLHYSASAFSA